MTGLSFISNNERNQPMTTTITEMTEDEFDDRYKLVPNHLNPNAGWAYGDSNSCLFETFGEELDYVRTQDPRTIWTLVDGSDGDLYLQSGYHFVNRIGYLLSTLPVPVGTEIQVRIPMSDDDELIESESEERP
jgi:hypothetical protein